MDRFRSWKARLLQTTAKRRDTRAHLSKRESHTDRTSVLPRPPGAPEPDTPIKTNKHQFQSRDSSPPQDLWQCAFEQLGQEDQDVLQPSRESTPNQGDENGLRPKNLVEQAIETTENIYEEYQQNGGIKIKTPKGRNVELRKVAGKIINAALSVQDLINKGVACDPTGYAASAWAVVSLGLTMTKNHYDRRDDLFDSAEYLVEVLARCAYYEVKSLWPQSSENHMVRSGLVQVYKAILQYTANVEMARKQDAGRKFLDSITAITSQRIKEGKSSIERTEANLMGLIQLESINTSRKAAEEILTAIDNKLLEPLKDITLNFGLPIAEGAILGFYANQRDNASICLEDTRVDVIAQISRWAESPEGRFFWLNGMAGTGKSTIARTIATLFQAKDQLGATFFFKKDEAERGNAKRFISTIAKQLMSHNHQLASKIFDAIKKDPQISAKALSEQFAKLLLRPLQGSTQARNRVMVIVIDALDECSREDLRIILKLLPDLQKIQNIRLKIFLTSRPEHHMCQGIKEMRSDVQILALHGIEDSIVERDIRLFLVKSLEDIRKQNSSLYSTNWPADDAIEKLVKKSVPLFIYADTVCRFIEDGGKQPQLCIDEILESQAGLVGDKMESLYEAVLGQLLNPEFKYGAKRRQKEFRDIVGVIVLLAAPLSIQALGRLLPDPISAGDVRYLLDKLRSVLKVPANDYSPVAVLHESFREFALRTNSEFRVDMQDMHETIASHCLRVMEVLKRDICNLQDYGIKRADIDSQKIKQCLQPELQYSCRYWVYHLERGTALTTKEGISGVHILKFLQRHLLHWLEAMSLIGLISDAVEMIVKLQLMEQKTPDSELSQFLFDTKRFVLRNLHMTETAPLQLYSSALMFSPTESMVRKQFEEERIEKVDILPQVKRSWNANLQTLEGHSDWVRSVVFSPNGQTMASGSDDEMIKLWDAKTGNELQTLVGHSGSVRSVAFSPDGQTVASGSDDHTIKLWDIKLGKKLRTLKGHSGSVRSVAFSPNGKTVASGSVDKMIKLWDAKTGNELKTLKGHSGSIRSVAFSPDGQTVASGSDSRTIKLWDTKTAEELLTLKGHSGSVWSVAFSPNGKTVVSGSVDMMAKLWDTETAEELLTLKGHSGSVWSVVFSLDGQTIASGSDETIKLWDVKTGNELQTLVGHSGSIRSLAFSPDGQTVASGGKTFEIWDAKMGKELQTLEGHSDCIRSMVFSPDGQTMASGSDDMMIKLWDVKTGKEPQTLKGHSGSVHSVVFTPDGQIIASGSDDKMIKLWDITSGKELRTLKGHFGSVRSVAFSPNGKTVASGSVDKMIKLWDAKTGNELQTLVGHSDPVRSVAFSPDGQTVASGSRDMTIKLWNTKTGKELRPLKGHSDSILSMAFSRDGKTIASGSDDETIKLWDAKTGNELQTRVGHSGSVRSVAFSADGQTVASDSYDMTIKLWDAITGEELQTLEGHSHSVESLAGQKSSNPDSQVSIANEWIAFGMKNLIWLPIEYRVFSCSAIQGGALALGYFNGTVSIVGFLTDQ